MLIVFISLLSAGYGQWQTWKGCVLAGGSGNDGDSFIVSYQGKQHVIRLYFVDTPETDKTNVGGPRQVAEQASHFGKTEQEVMHVGKFAKEFTARLLRRPFTVVTQGTDARGNSAGGRIFGFVITADGQDLGEELVRNGLARSYGLAEAPPGQSVRTLRARYDRLEARAKRNRVGAYSPEPLRSIALASGREEELDNGGLVTEADQPASEQPNDGFLGPDISFSPPPATGNSWAAEEARAATTAQSSESSTAGVVASSRLNSGINVNSASRAELEQLPGIGPTIAQRIIDGRPYHEPEDLRRVQGIGPKILGDILPLIALD